ncbi:MAG TPA: DNA ligase D [Ignavibacteriaceae bacterium]|nr:DNA ligase D [Ignavibacteriaceae bacterium]
MPHNIKPMLATLTDPAWLELNEKDKSFKKDNWLYEIKWDGYRAIAEIENGGINLYSRNGNSFNKKFSAVADSLQRNIGSDIILDGEIVILDPEGRARFQLLQNYQRTGYGSLIYYVFDVIYLDGFDLSAVPLLKRKEILKKILPETPNIKYNDHLIGRGLDFYKAALDRQLEGILVKKTNSCYYFGKRTQEWLKIKTKLRQEAVIGGFTKPKGSRDKFGALVLGVFSGEQFLYIGHTGGGFTQDDLEFIYSKLKPLITKISPFKIPPKTNTPVTWVLPKLVCEVEFSEWTGEGAMRQPVYLGLREDKDPKAVVREKISEELELKGTEGLSAEDKETNLYINGKKVKVLNLEKIFWPEEGYTKGDLIEYYRKISKYILPYLKGRPESLNRHPNGIDEKSFYQKDVSQLTADWLETAEIYSESNKKNVEYFICSDEASLIYMANLGCIEINPWFSRIQSVDNPDYAVIDLDPVDISFEEVIKTAVVAKEVLDKGKIKSFCKTSGATGMHIYIPLKAKYNYEIASNFTHLICRIINGRIPKITSLERNPQKRKGKVYLDYLQNRAGQTLAAPYSLRPRKGAPVSAPLMWDEVKPGLYPEKFNIKSIFKRLEKIGDIFSGVLVEEISIESCLKNLENKK